jgi:hypothetical protein
VLTTRLSGIGTIDVTHWETEGLGSQMKRLLVRFGVAVGLLAAPLAMVTGGPAGAQDILPGVVDVGVSINVRTPQVSPPGTLAMYDVSVTEGAVVVPGTVSVALPAGSSVDTDLTDPACTASGASVSCGFATARTFKVVATTPAAGTYSVSADVVATGDLAPLEYDNGTNHASASITVKPLPDGVAAGVVKTGQSISLNLSGGRTYSLTVPATSNIGEKGVIVTIKGEAAAGHTCTGGTCAGDGYNVVFDNSIPGYTWTDFTNPLVSISAYGESPPCRGLGNACWDLGFTDDPSPTSTLVTAPYCLGASGGSTGNGQALPTSLCVNAKFKVSNIINFDVRMTSTDPITLPIGNLG